MIKIIKSNASKHMAVAGTFAMSLATVASQGIVMAGWDGFEDQMRAFFEYGLGGPGLRGIGIAIMVIGFVAAIISFVVHKFNPQSRMPGWITCCVIALFGAIAMGGLSQPVKLFESARDLIYGWIGI